MFEKNIETRRKQEADGRSFRSLCFLADLLLAWINLSNDPEEVLSGCFHSRNAIPGITGSLLLAKVSQEIVTWADSSLIA